MGRNKTNLRHLRKPVEFKMLLRPILLHVARYSEYMSDRDTEPSGYVSKCAFSLLKKRTKKTPQRWSGYYASKTNADMNYSNESVSGEILNLFSGSFNT